MSNTKYAYRKTIDKKRKIYKYYDENGAEIHNKNTLEYLRTIYIPPAYKNVKIDLNPNARVRVKGIDKAGRQQWLYNPTWVKKTSERKYCRLIQFGKVLPKIRRDIEITLNNKEGKEKIIALILYIIINCKFRIGNKKFKEAYNSYGITTLTKRQVKITNGSILFDFIGKKGVPNQCLLKDKKIAGIMRNLYNNRTAKENLFIYENKIANEKKEITSCDINDYLKKYGKITSKDFRTWIANIQFLTYLKEMQSTVKQHTEKERKKVVKEVVAKTAEELHHTPAICKKSYINRQLLEDYITTGLVLKGDVETAFIKYLEKRCK